jgi:hypothetical protein
VRARGSAADGEQSFESCDVLLRLSAASRHLDCGWIAGVVRLSGFTTRRLARPGAKLPPQRPLNEAEKIPCGVSDGGLASPRFPLIEHRLLECRLEWLQCRECPGLLLRPQPREALRQAHARARARYCTDCNYSCPGPGASAIGSLTT